MAKIFNAGVATRWRKSFCIWISFFHHKRLLNDFVQKLHANTRIHIMYGLMYHIYVYIYTRERERERDRERQREMCDQIIRFLYSWNEDFICYFADRICYVSTSYMSTYPQRSWEWTFRDSIIGLELVITVPTYALVSNGAKPSPEKNEWNFG